MTLFTGSGVAIVTPFTDSGDVNFKKLEELIHWQIESGTDSIVICGTTGEASTLNDQDHLKCIETAVKATNGRVPVIAGTGSNDTQHGIHLSVEAEKLGVDGLLQVTPYYNKTTQEGLIKHFGAIAEKVSVPIMLYNVPSRTGMYIQPDTALALANKYDHIVALKEASGNIGHVVELAYKTRGKLDLYSGNDDQILPLLSLGGKGVVSVIANVLPKDTHDVVAKYLAGDLEGALAVHDQMHDIMNAMFIETNPIPVKEALNQMGKAVGSCRLPLTNMTESNLAILRDAMASYGLDIKED